ncbi:FRG domain-containing protein [Inediibacterium massiliense]|uniref:FRG domain-containing protein n=1 Tax=Inediibacterium massiliense TaxID=1658111 RepID=UPI0006B43674|nr:FRG domain-containing protein [Inediibacterium massiliense]
MLGSFLKDYYDFFMKKNMLSDFLREGSKTTGMKKQLHIDNIYDYLKIINMCETEKQQDRFNLAKNFLYRGVTNKEWKLEPSLGFNNLVFYESRMIFDFLELRPDEFKNMDDFNIIAKMQHYGLPTRLLDFTMNPLIALYFACCDTNGYDVDGKIYIALPYGNDNMNDYIKQVCSIYKKLDFNLVSDLGYFYTYIQLVYGTNNIFFVRPNYITEREKRQESIFLLFANGLYNYDTDSIITDKEGVSMYTSNDAKLPSLIKYADSLHDVCERDLEQNFIEIIIPKEIKEKLLNSVGKLGIRKDYIFPELEYTAEYLKSKYKKMDMIVKKNEFKEEYNF